MKKISTLLTAFLFTFFASQAQLIVFGEDYAANVSFAPFGGSVNDITIDATQAHSGSKSLKIRVTTGYTGGALVASAPVDLSGYNVLTFWAKNDMAYSLNAAGIGNNASSTTYAVERNDLVVTSTWQKFYIPIPVSGKLTAETGLFHFAEGMEANTYNIWIDDIQYETVAAGVIGTPTAAFATETQTKEVGTTFGAVGTTSTFPVNGVNQSMATAKAYFTWTSSEPSVATINNEGVGTALAVGTTTVTGKLGTVDAAGTLTINVIAANQPNTAAPMPPARSATDVISLFSGAYTNRTGIEWYPNWGQTTVVSDVDVAGNPTKKYTNLNYQGVNFSPAIDASAMTKIHFDLWTNSVTAFDLFLINPGPVEQKVTVTPTAGQWNSFDIDLSQFATINKNNIFQFKLEGRPAGGTVYLDNIYFYTGTSLPVTLSDFTINRRGNASVLSWKTALEVNNKGFAIERSADGRNWQQINFVNAGLGNTLVKSYAVTDNNPVKGTNYYRLKQVDNDGRFTYSPVVSLRYLTNGILGFSFYPNPAKNQVVVQLENVISRNANLQLVDAEGKVVKSVSLSDRNSNTNVIVNITSLAKGMYYLVLRDGPAVNSTQLLIN